MIRNSRGDLEIKYVVGLVIAIVVVYVVIIFFMGGVQGLGAKFGLLSEKSSAPVDTFDLSQLISDSGSTPSSAAAAPATTSPTTTTSTATTVDPNPGSCTTGTTCTGRNGKCVNDPTQTCTGHLHSGVGWDCTPNWYKCCCAN